jgi:hypothetical protein
MVDEQGVRVSARKSERAIDPSQFVHFENYHRFR